MLRELDLTLTAYSLAPCWRRRATPYYGLFVERGDLADADAGRGWRRRWTRQLCEANIEYDSEARRAGGWGRCGWSCCRPGFWAKWDRERLAQTGGTLEQYKHPCLIGDHGFAEQVRGENALAEAG